MSTQVTCCGSGEGASGAAFCRTGGRMYPAVYDTESGSVTCPVPQDLVVPDIKYDVIDTDGKVICRGGKSCHDDDDPSRACNKGLKHASDGGAVLGQLSWLDKLLPLWIILAMVLGVLLGWQVPEVREALNVAHVADVSLPIALGLWLMMLPVLTKVRYELLHVLLTQRAAARQLGASFALNWLVGPALMTGLAWACLPDLPDFRTGVIMVGLARCIAMVLIWNQLAGGHADLCAVLVATNSVLQIVLYAPLYLLYVNVISGGTAGVPFWPVARSVLIFLGVPLVAGILLRLAVIGLAGRAWFERRFMPVFGPVALLALVYTIVVMFAAQGDQIIGQIGDVARTAVPMLIYFLLMFSGSLALSWYMHMPYSFAATQAFTAASNNFELAIAVAVAVYGVGSQQALAAVVGPLIEVPVLLALVYAALWFKGRYYDARDAQLQAQGKMPPDFGAADDWEKAGSERGACWPRQRRRKEQQQEVPVSQQPSGGGVELGTQAAAASSVGRGR